MLQPPRISASGEDLPLHCGLNRLWALSPICLTLVAIKMEAEIHQHLTNVLGVEDGFMQALISHGFLFLFFLFPLCFRPFQIPYLPSYY